MPYEQGIFIDIFPLDAVSDNKMVRTWQNFHCYCIRKMMWAPVGMIVSKGKAMKLWYQVLNSIPADALYGHLREWYENSEKILFENEMFWSIRDYDAYLTFKFGDYGKLPPMEMRKVHPVTKLRCLQE